MAAKPLCPPAITTATLHPPGIPPAPPLLPPAPTYNQHHAWLSTNSHPAPNLASSPALSLTPCTHPCNPLSPEQLTPSPGVSKAWQKLCGPLRGSRDSCGPWQRPVRALGHSGGKHGPLWTPGKPGKSCKDALEGRRAPHGPQESLAKAVRNSGKQHGPLPASTKPVQSCGTLE